MTPQTKYYLVNGMTIKWSFILSLGVFGISTIEHRMGADRVMLQIPDSLKRYTLDHFMGGVDNIDKDKCIGGSFTGRVMFKMVLDGTNGNFRFYGCQWATGLEYVYKKP